MATQDSNSKAVKAEYERLVRRYLGLCWNKGINHPDTQEADRKCDDFVREHPEVVLEK